MWPLNELKTDHEKEEAQRAANLEHFRVHATRQGLVQRGRLIRQLLKALLLPLTPRDNLGAQLEDPMTGKLHVPWLRSRSPKRMGKAQGCLEVPIRAVKDRQQRLRCMLMGASV